MSTKPTPTAADLELTSTTEPFTIESAPLIFDPFNTRDCPQMFADKWTVSETSR